jgi:hypothetical protein
MTNDEARMTNQIQMTNDRMTKRAAATALVIGAWSLIRFLDFVIRHFTSGLIARNATD